MLLIPLYSSSMKPWRRNRWGVSAGIAHFVYLRLHSDKLHLLLFTSMTPIHLAQQLDADVVSPFPHPHFPMMHLHVHVVRFLSSGVSVWGRCIPFPFHHFALSLSLKQHRVTTHTNPTKPHCRGKRCDGPFLALAAPHPFTQLPCLYCCSLPSAGLAHVHLNYNIHPSVLLNAPVTCLTLPITHWGSHSDP